VAELTETVGQCIAKLVVVLNDQDANVELPGGASLAQTRVVQGTIRGATRPDVALLRRSRSPDPDPDTQRNRMLA